MMFQYLIFAISVVFTGFGCLFLFACLVGFLRQKDFLIKIHALSVSNIYGISLVLLGEALRTFDLSIVLETVLIAIVNIVLTLIIAHSMTRYGFLKGIKSSATNRRDLKKDKEEGDEENQD